ncbi:MAG: flagellar hook-basal body complex protein [Vampirovibrionia bacterium]
MSQGMFSAVTGIAANQTKLDVIADNIANLNTVAFKSTQVNFETVFSRTLTTGQAPVGNLGGTNPKQIGLGVKVADMSKDFNQGNVQSTGKASDLNIQGEGFFVLENGGAAVGAASGSLLTRAGNFSLDANGVMVNPNGLKVIGTNTVEGQSLPLGTTEYVTIPNQLNIDETTTPLNPVINTAGAGTGEDVTLTSFSVSSDGAINATYSNGGRLTVRTDPGTNNRILEYNTSGGTTFVQGTDLTITAGITPANLQLQFATVTNNGGLVAVGANLYSTSVNSGNPSFAIGRAGGVGLIASGGLETSNVDLTREFSQMMLSQRALEANSRSFDTHNSVLQTIVNLAR